MKKRHIAHRRCPAAGDASAHRRRAAEEAQSLHPRRAVEHGRAGERQHLRLHRRRPGDRADAQNDAGCRREADGVRRRLDFVSDRRRRKELRNHRQTDGRLRVHVGAGPHQARRQDRAGVHLRSHDGRGAATSRCSSSRRRGAARACTRISARRARGRIN